MKKYIPLIFSILVASCTSNLGQTKLVAKLPKQLKEVSGITTIKGSELIWMHNDSGNKSELYGVTLEGRIEKVVKIKAKNHDWEDVTSDENGNIYIGDFGNNNNVRKNLVILKVNNQDLSTKKSVEVEKIKFSYPNQHKFPPKKKERFFDAESFFYAHGNLYIFTKSRVKKHYGKTSLYKIPAKKGVYVARHLVDFNTQQCNNLSCCITSAAISPNGKKVALLNHKKVLIFTNYPIDNYLKGSVLEYDLGFSSQKEAVTFKTDNILFITDEKAHGKGGNLYQFELK